MGALIIFGNTSAMLSGARMTILTGFGYRAHNPFRANLPHRLNGLLLG